MNSFEFLDSYLIIIVQGDSIIIKGLKDLVYI